MQKHFLADGPVKPPCLTEDHAQYFTVEHLREHGTASLTAEFQSVAPHLIKGPLRSEPAFSVLVGPHASGT